MNMNRLGLVAVSVGALMTLSVGAGAADPTTTIQLAQASGTGSGSGATGSGTPGTSSDRNMQRDGATGDGTSAGSSSGRSDSGSSTRMGTSSGAAGAEFTQDLKGKDVVDSKGDKIGTVDTVVGDRLIVSSGGVLGIGDRKVALGPSQVTLSGSGTERRIIATVSRDQLKSMPEYNESTESPGRSQSPTSPSTPGGNRSGSSGSSR